MLPSNGPRAWAAASRQSAKIDEVRAIRAIAGILLGGVAEWEGEGGRAYVEGACGGWVAERVFSDVGSRGAQRSPCVGDNSPLLLCPFSSSATWRPGYSSANEGRGSAAISISKRGQAGDARRGKQKKSPGCTRTRPLQRGTPRTRRIYKYIIVKGEGGDCVWVAVGFFLGEGVGERAQPQTSRLQARCPSQHRGLCKLAPASLKPWTDVPPLIKSPQRT